MSNKIQKPKKKLKSLFPHLIDIWLVEWNDHCSTSQGWIKPDEVAKNPLPCRSVGFKVHEDKNVLILAQNVDQNGKVSETMTILKPCIVKRRKIT